MKKILIGLLILTGLGINIINAQVIKGDITSKIESEGLVTAAGKIIFNLAKMEMEILDKEEHQIIYFKIKETKEAKREKDIKMYYFSAPADDFIVLSVWDYEDKMTVVIVLEKEKKIQAYLCKLTQRC